MTVAALKRQLVGSVKRVGRHLGVEVSRHRPLGHELWFLRDRGICSVLDVGANTGQFAAMIRQVLPGAFIHSFEPGEQAFRELAEQAAGDPRMAVHPVGCGSASGTATLNVSASSPSSSILPMAGTHKTAFPDTASSTPQSIEIVRLDDWAADKTLEPGLLLKLDVQGYELEVLDGAPQLLAEVDAVLCEVAFVELYQGQPLFDGVYQRMRDAGMVCRAIYNPLAHPKTFEILQADAVFTRGV